MGSNIEAKKFKKWLEKNSWKVKRTSAHETWVYLQSGESITINFHRNKGSGMAEDSLGDIAKIMSISKKELINKVRNS